jgi:tetratricopeptide (TPR) repeat protein
MFNRLSLIIVGIIISLNCVATSTFATNGIALQKEADLLREEGKSLKAIDVYNQAIVLYQQEKDYSNMMGALTGRLLSWKHLFYKTEDKIYAIFVKKETEGMLEIAKEHHLLNRLYLIHFLNGTSAILLKDYSSAEIEFKNAVELYPLENAEKGDWIAHLGDAMYRNGKKEEGKKMILQGVSLIKERSSQIDSFLFNVWVSGAYLRLAKLLKTDNLEESQSFLNQAKEIIESDPRLVIRKQQLEAFMKNLGDY